VTTPIKTAPAFRRLALYGLIMLAFLLTSAAVFVVMTDDPLLAVEDAFPEPVILDPERHPSFIFPEAARTSDLVVNRFVDRFARVCTSGKYSEFRLLLSRRHPPILPPRFESNFNAVKQVRVLAVELLPPISGAVVPMALLHVEYELEDFAVRNGVSRKQVQVAIVREQGELRIGPVPGDALARLRAFQAQHETKGEAAPDSTGSDSLLPPESAGSARLRSAPTPATQPDASATKPPKADSAGGAVANRPMRIGS
jgi:hypothetical protein